MAKVCNWEITDSVSAAKTKMHASIEYALSFPTIAKSAANLSNFAVAYQGISSEEKKTGNRRPKRLAPRALKRKKS